MILALISLGISILSVYKLYPWLMSGYQAYPEFIAGLIGFDDYNKTGEGNVLKITLLLFFVVLPLLYTLFRGTRTPYVRSSFQTGVILTIGALLGRAIIKGTCSIWMMLFLVVLGMLALIRDERISNSITRSFLTAPAVFLSGLGTLTLISIFSTQPYDLETARNYIIILALAGAAASGVMEYWGRNSSTRFFLITQLPAIFIPLKILHLSVYGTVGEVPFEVSNIGQAFVYILVAAGLLHLTYKIITAKAEDSPQIQWPFLVAAGFLFSFSFPTPSTLMVDEFHLGEMMLPWHQIAEKGMRAYDDFVPVQGLIGLVLGSINAVFFKGTIATFTVSCVVLNCICGITITLLTATLLGPTAAFFLAPIALPSLDRFFMMPMIFLVLANPRLLAKTRLWFLLAATLSCIGFFWNAPSTIALVAAASPIALSMLYDQVKSEENRLSKVVHLLWPSFIVVAAAFIIFPLRGVLIFVWENGYINTVQHASKFIQTWDLNPWFPQYFSSRKANRIAWELIRTGGWGIGSCLLYLMLLVGWRRYSLRDARGFYLLSLGGILFSIILFPYSMGRIDPPVHLSRPGVVSMMVLAFFIPVSFLYARRFLSISPVPALVAGFMLGLPLGIRGYTFSSLLDVPRTQVNAPADYTVIDGTSAGIPLFGHGYAPPAKVSELASFKRALDKVLPPGGTYADLTNHSAYYALLNLPNPYLYPSANAVGTRIQRRIIDKYESIPPQVVFVTPMIEIDRASASLRNYLLYRWLIQHDYKLVTVDAYSFLLSPEQFAKSGLPEASEAAWNRSFLRSDLFGLPRAWGRSYKSLKKLVTEKEIPIQLTATDKMLKEKEGWMTALEENPSFSLSFGDPVDGNSYDYLLIRLERKVVGIKKPQINLTLNHEDSTSSFNFWGYADTMIIPVSSAPQWFKKKTSGFTLGFEKESVGASWRIKSVKLLTLLQNQSPVTAPIR